MKFFKIVSLIVVALFYAHQALHAQATGTASKLKISTKLSVDKATAGSTFNVAVLVVIADGWHVNSNSPTSDYLIGTKLEFAQQENFAFGNLAYPPGKNIKFAFSDEPLNVYEKGIKIFFTATVSKNAKPRKDTLNATLTVQACNDQLCLAPSKVEVKIPVTIVDAKEKSKSINGKIFSSYRPSDSK